MLYLIKWNTKKSRKLAERRNLIEERSRDPTPVKPTLIERHSIFCSLEVDGIFVNPFPEWRGIPFWKLCLRQILSFVTPGLSQSKTVGRVPY